MRRIVRLCGIAASLATAAYAQPEDEAHRLDRLETRRLNEAAAMRMAKAIPVDRAPAPAVVAPPPPQLSPAEVALRQREEQALANWRDRVAACRSGQARQC